MTVRDVPPFWWLLILAALSAAVVRVMVGAGVMDTPDARKSHVRPTPKGGGAGPLAAVCAGALASALWNGSVFHPLVLLAGAGLAVLALLDDARDFRFTVKLGAQVLAAVLAVAGGVVLHAVDVPGLGTAELGLWAVPVTLAWILFTTNAVNFIDGLNGLAAGASLLACLLLAVVFVPGSPTAAVCLFLVAGLAGFLPFNYPRARIFMGDVGSQFCGYLLAVLSVAAANDTAPALAGPLLLAGILFDVAFTLCRRALAGQRVWEPHRGHLYQVAQRSGVGAAWVALIHWGFVLWGALCAAWLRDGWGWAVPLALAPQLAWAFIVAGLARRARLGRW